MHRQSGFTLIELMVTVAVVAILAAVALPSYTQFIIRGKLQEGTSNLLAMRTKMELYFQDNRSYVGACVAGTTAALPTGLKYFTITCTPPPTATTYVVQVDGLGGDMAGLTMTIDQANVRRTVTVPAGWTLPVAPAAPCWITKKSGQC
jgi:type IV pilus assembly protein PilE